MRLWTKQVDEGVHAATSVVSSAIAFRYQKLAQGMETLEAFHKRMPDPVKRERSWENITKGVESTSDELRTMPLVFPEANRSLTTLAVTPDSKRTPSANCWTVPFLILTSFRPLTRTPTPLS